MNKIDKFLTFFLIVLLVGTTLYLRLANLGYSNFQGDEIKTLCLLDQDQDLISFLLGQRKGPVQFLVTCLLRYFDPNFSSELILRIPFSLANIFAVFLFYKLISLHFGKRIAIYSSLLMAVNGLIVAFGRIAQYQSITIMCTVGALYFLSEAVYTPKWRLLGLYLGLFTASIGILAHFDGLFVIPPAIFLVYWWYKNHKLNSEIWSYRRHLLVSSIIFLVPLAVFYIPYTLALSDYQFDYWVGRISGNPSDSLELFKLYNPTIVVNIYIALAILSLFRIRRNHSFIFLSLWLLPAFVFIELVMSNPRTHFYIYLLPLFVFIALGIESIRSILERFLPLSGHLIIKSGSVLLFTFVFLLSHAIFINHQEEYPWETESFLSWELSSEMLPGMMGFSYSCGWREISQFLREYQGKGMTWYISNEKDIINRFYLPINKYKKFELDKFNKVGEDESIFVILCERPQSWSKSLLGHSLYDWKIKRTPVKIFLDKSQKVQAFVYQLKKDDFSNNFP